MSPGSPTPFLTQNTGPDVSDSLILCHTPKSRPVAPDSPDLYLTPEPRNQLPCHLTMGSTQKTEQLSPESPCLYLTQQPWPVTPDSPDLYVTQQDPLNETDSFLAELDCQQLSCCTPKNEPLLTEASEGQEQAGCEPKCSPVLQCSSHHVDQLNTTSGFESDCSLFGDSLLDNQKQVNTMNSVQLSACERNTKFSLAGIHTNGHLKCGPSLGGPSFTNRSTSSPFSTSFHERLKSRLLQNAKHVLMPDENKMGHKREEMVQQALREAVKLKEQVLSQPEIKSDSGHFYGLSDRVKELLNKHRGITKLYG